MIEYYEIEIKLPGEDWGDPWEVTYDTLKEAEDSVAWSIDNGTIAPEFEWRFTKVTITREVVE